MKMTFVHGVKEEKMRLIDADALKELIANNVYPVQDVFNDRDYGMFWTGGIEKAIDDVPTVLEVVRCKDCKHYWKNSTTTDAPLCLASPKDDAFCSEAERIKYEID